MDSRRSLGISAICVLVWLMAIMCAQIELAKGHKCPEQVFLREESSNCNRNSTELICNVTGEIRNAVLQESKWYGGLTKIEIHGASHLSLQRQCNGELTNIIEIVNSNYVDTDDQDGEECKVNVHFYDSSANSLTKNIKLLKAVRTSIDVINLDSVEQFDIENKSTVGELSIRAKDHRSEIKESEIKLVKNLIIEGRLAFKANDSNFGAIDRFVYNSSNSNSEMSHGTIKKIKSSGLIVVDGILTLSNMEIETLYNEAITVENKGELKIKNSILKDVTVDSVVAKGGGISFVNVIAGGYKGISFKLNNIKGTLKPLIPILAGSETVVLRGILIGITIGIVIGAVLGIGIYCIILRRRPKMQVSPPPGAPTTVPKRSLLTPVDIQDQANADDADNDEEALYEDPQNLTSPTASQSRCGLPPPPSAGALPPPPSAGGLPPPPSVGGLPPPPFAGGLPPPPSAGGLPPPPPAGLPPPPSVGGLPLPPSADALPLPPSSACKPFTPKRPSKTKPPPPVRTSSQLQTPSCPSFANDRANQSHPDNHKFYANVHQSEAHMSQPSLPQNKSSLHSGSQIQSLLSKFGQQKGQNDGHGDRGGSKGRFPPGIPNRPPPTSSPSSPISGNAPIEEEEPIYDELPEGC